MILANWLRSLARRISRRTQRRGGPGAARSLQTWTQKIGRPVALESERLEERCLLAAVSDSGTDLTISLEANENLAVVSNGSTYAFTSNTFFSNGGVSSTGDFSTFGSFSLMLTLQASGLTRYSTVNIVDGGSTATVTFNTSGANTYTDSFNVVLDHASAGAITFNGATVFAGSNSLSASTAKNIAVNSGASVTTANGNLTLFANQQVTPTAGSFTGLLLTDALIQVTGTGDVTIRGKGGNSGSSQIGIKIFGTSDIIGGTSGLVTVEGTGGASSGTGNIGVDLSVGGFVNYASITSSGASVSVTGTAGGTGSSGSNRGVFLGKFGEISAGGSGTVTVVGYGGVGTANTNEGVNVTESRIISAGGNISVTGTGGGTGISSDNNGVYLNNAGSITAGGSGSTTTILGQGGNSAGIGGTNHGVRVGSSTISSTLGNTSVTGIEGGGSTSIAIVAAASGNYRADGTGRTLTLIGDSMSIATNANVTANASITLRQRTNGVAIDLGAATDSNGGPLSLSDAELDRVVVASGGTINIGNALSGAITVSGAISRAAATNMNLVSGSTITGTASINTNGGILTVTQNAAAVNLSVSATTGTEAGNTVITVTATVSSPVSGNQTVTLGVSGTNITADDYTLSSSTITIPNGSTTGSVTFTVKDDLLNEGNETATLTISNPSSGLSLGTTTSQSVNITDDDNAGTSNFGFSATGAFRVVRNGSTLEIRDSGNSLVASRPIGTEAVIINGSSGNDTLTVDFSGGNFSVPVTFNGGSQSSTPGDSLILTGGTFANVTHNFSNANAGTVTVTGNSTISYTGLEPITDNLNATDRVFTFNGGAEAITVTDGTAADGKTMIDSDLSESVYFTNPSGSLTINAGTGNDTVTITSVDAAYNVDLTINGDADNDTVNLNGDITFASGKSLIVSTETLNTGAGADLTTSGVGVITITADDLALDATSTLVSASTVTIKPQTAARAIDLGTNTAGQLSLTDVELDRITAGTVQIGATNSGTITVSAAITHANNLSLTTGAGLTVNQAVTMAVNKNLTANSTSTTAGINLATTNSDITTSGTGAVSLTTTRNISLSSGSSVTTVEGGITLDANQQTTATTGNFTGVDVLGGTVQSTGSGSVTVRGRSGDTGSRGVFLNASGDIIGGTSGLVTVQGVTVGTGSNRNAVYATGSGTTITANGANISITGQAAGSSANNAGVLIITGASVFATGSGSLTIHGTGGTGSSTNNQGVTISDLGSSTVVSTVNGNLSITGVEGSGTVNFGFHYTGGGGGRIETTGTGNLSITTDTVEMIGTGTIRATGTGSLTIKPRTATTTIGIGGGAGTLNLTDTALAYLADGFSSITIGAIGGGTPATTETFSSTSLPAGFDTFGPGSAPTLNGSTVTFAGTGAGGGGRKYLRTQKSDYDTADFVAEVSVFTAGNDNYNYFGLGSGTLSSFNNPYGGASVVFEGNYFGGDAGNTIDNGAAVASISGIFTSNQTHRIRLAWNATAKTATFSVDQNYTSGPFVADFTFAPIDASNNGFNGTNGRLFFGGAETSGGFGVVYDDFTVQPAVVPGAVDVDSSTFRDPVTILGGSISITELNAGSNAVTLTASGAITDGGNAGADVTSGSLVATSTAGVGTVGDALDTAISNLEAVGGAGGVFVANAGPLTIGGIGATVGLSATNAAISISSTSSVTATELISSGGGNVSVIVTDAGATLSVNGNVSGAGGAITLQATGHLNVAASTTIDSGIGALNLAADSDGNGAGTLTINAGGVATSANTATTAITLRGADLALLGTVQTTGQGGGVIIRSSVTSRPMSLGGDDAAVVGINLTDAELAQIVTLASGTVTFGDSGQSGDITLKTAKTATTAGAATVVR